jgi:hypothetical protein
MVKNELFKGDPSPPSRSDAILVPAAGYRVAAGCSENYLFREKIVNFILRIIQGDLGETDDTR